MFAMSIDQKFFVERKMVVGWMGSSTPVPVEINHIGTCVVIGILGAIFAFFLIVRKNVKKAQRFEVYNKTVYEPAMRDWQLKYYCHRCDTVFKPSA